MLARVMSWPRGPWHGSVRWPARVTCGWITAGRPGRLRRGTVRRRSTQQLSAVSRCGGGVGVGGVEAGEQGVEAVFESAVAAGAAQVWGQGHDGGDLFGGQCGEFEGVDFAHLVEADGVGVEGEEGVGGGGGGKPACSSSCRTRSMMVRPWGWIVPDLVDTRS